MHTGSGWTAPQINWERTALMFCTIKLFIFGFLFFMLPITIKQFHMWDVCLKEKSDFIGNVGERSIRLHDKPGNEHPSANTSPRKKHRHQINWETYTHRCRNGLFPLWNTPSRPGTEKWGSGTVTLFISLKGQFLHMLSPFTVNAIHVHGGFWYLL